MKATEVEQALAGAELVPAVEQGIVEAKRLVVRGFINDLVQRIPLADLRQRLLARVEQRLGAHDPLPA